MTTATSDAVRLRPGWMVVARKEAADHLLSVRFVALLVVLALVGIGAVYVAAGAISDLAAQGAEAPSLFLKLFSVSADPIPFSFVTFVGFLAPLLGIGFGFDAINGERAQSTLPRLVSQPIHRDDVINGKFAAALGVVGLILTVVTLLVGGMGIVALGIVPTVGEITRLAVWLLTAIFYVGVWLAFATLCSTMLRRAATSALVALAVWIVLTLFMGLIANLTADVVTPVDEANPITVVDNARTELNISRLSPVTLYEESAAALLNPEVRTVGLVTVAQIDRAVTSSLSVTQSILLIWAQLTGLIAATIVIFVGAYLAFMRQEIRA